MILKPLKWEFVVLTLRTRGASVNLASYLTATMKFMSENEILSNVIYGSAAYQA